MKNSPFFYLEKIEGAYSFVLEPEHPLFAAHFPTYPILPGSCLSDIIVKAVEDSLEKKVRISNVSLMKFISPVFPKINVRYKLILKVKELEGKWLVDVSVVSEEKAHCKAKLFFVEQ